MKIIIINLFLTKIIRFFQNLQGINHSPLNFMHCRHRELVDPNGISVSQLVIDLLPVIQMLTCSRFNVNADYM